MSDQSRALPRRPNLRYLKLEAKRRLAAGEFATLHDAQLAIAREHGLPSWAALKARVGAAAGPESPALTQVRWVVSRFRGADAAAWTAPDDEELRAHFGEHFLTVVPPATLVSTLTGVAAQLREELVVTSEAPLRVRAQVGDLQVEAAAEAGPPYRLTGLRAYPLGRRVTDPRAAAPATRTSGDAPARAATVAAESVAELGLPGLAVAGAGGDGAGTGAVWTVARGWADLDRGEALQPGHRFPAYSITKLVTATAVLRLAADGRIGLDDPANDHLRTVRLAGATVTVRELLTHTGGVDSPGEVFAASVPSLLSLTGPVLGCDGPRGTFSYSNGGYAVLGQLIADVTGSPYEDAAARLVLAPLGMAGSWFPGSWPDSDAVSGYRLAGDGSFEPVPPQVATIPAAGGLWSTAADLVRFGLGWTSLLPAALAREALRPQADRDQAGARIGLGWLVHEPMDVCGHAGGGPSGATSLIIRRSTGQVSVALTNRLVPVEPVNARLVRPLA